MREDSTRYYENHVHSLRQSSLNFRVQSVLSSGILNSCNIGAITGLRVAEVGPGFGFLGSEIVKQGGAYLGIEPTESLRSYLAANAPTLKVINASLPNLSDLPSEASHSFDVVIAHHVIEHAPTSPEALAWLAGLKTLARPGGMIAIIVPDIDSYGKYFWSCDYTHSTAFSRASLEALMRDAGLERVKVQRTRFGRSSLIVRTGLRVVRCFFPIGAVDLLTHRWLGYPLGTGIATAALLASLVAVAEAPSSPE